MDDKLYRQLEQTFYAFIAEGEKFKDNPSDKHLLNWLDQAKRSHRIIKSAVILHLGDKTPPWV